MNLLLIKFTGCVSDNYKDTIFVSQTFTFYCFSKHKFTGFTCLKFTGFVSQIFMSQSYRFCVANHFKHSHFKIQAQLSL